MFILSAGTHLINGPAYSLGISIGPVVVHPSCFVLQFPHDPLPLVGAGRINVLTAFQNSRIHSKHSSPVLSLPPRILDLVLGVGSDGPNDRLRNDSDGIDDSYSYYDELVVETL